LVSKEVGRFVDLATTGYTMRVEMQAVELKR
jgi:hypothetical protein